MWKIFLSILFLIFNYNNINAATLVSSEDFESSSWADSFSDDSHWEDSITRTTNDPHGGSYSIRWNQDSTRTDPITGLIGIGSTQFIWEPSGVVAATPDDIFFRFWVRHDDYNNSVGSQTGPRKLLFFMDDDYGTRGMYLAMQGGVGNVRLSYANGDYPPTWAEDNWGYSGMYFQVPGFSPGLNGEWVQYEIHWNYDDNYIQMWIDDNLVLPSATSDYWDLYPTEAAAGKILFDPDQAFALTGLLLAYYDQSRDLVSESDGTGYSAGIQFDDLEIWDGIPGESEDNTMIIHATYK